MAAKTVLIVEDNEDNRMIYGAVLLHYGYEVLLAADGIDGLTRARDALPDLILLDISLPLLSGWEVARQLLTDPRTQHIIIVGLTAHTGAADLKRARDLGFHGYLLKPVSPRKVVHEVDRMLGVTREPESRPTEPDPTALQRNQ